jgi:hypothetical protein
MLEDIKKNCRHFYYSLEAVIFFMEIGLEIDEELMLKFKDMLDEEDFKLVEEYKTMSLIKGMTYP